MTDKHARRPKDGHDGHRRHSQDHHQPRARSATRSNSRTNEHEHQGQRATRSSATPTSAFPVVASSTASSATPPGDDRRNNATLVRRAQNVAPASSSASEILMLTETFMDRAKVNRDDPRQRISAMTLQNAIARQDQEIRRLRADLQLRASQYYGLMSASNTIPEREVQLENRVETLELENRQLRWQISKLGPVGTFIERQHMQIEQKKWHIEELNENRKEIEEDNEKLESDVAYLEKEVENLKKDLEKEKAERQKDKEDYTKQLSKSQQPTCSTGTPTISSDPPSRRIFESPYLRGLDTGPASGTSSRPTTQAPSPTLATASHSERDTALSSRRSSAAARLTEHPAPMPPRPDSRTSRLSERRYYRDRSMSPLRSPPRRDSRDARAPTPPTYRDFRDARAPTPPTSRRFLTETDRYRPEDAIANPNRDSLSATLSRHPRKITSGLSNDTPAGPARLGSHNVESPAPGQQPLSRHDNLTRNDGRRSSGRRLQCNACHAQGSSCDGGIPCHNCKGKGKCRYRACYQYSRGLPCTSKNCTMVHDEIDHL